jgi:hypothetical protein
MILNFGCDLAHGGIGAWKVKTQAYYADIASSRRMKLVRDADPTGRPT